MVLITSRMKLCCWCFCMTNKHLWHKCQNDLTNSPPKSQFSVCVFGILLLILFQQLVVSCQFYYEFSICCINESGIKYNFLIVQNNNFQFWERNFRSKRFEKYVNQSPLKNDVPLSCCHCEWCTVISIHNWIQFIENKRNISNRISLWMQLYELERFVVM